MILILEDCIETRLVDLRILYSLNGGSKCSSGFEKVIMRIALFWRITKGPREEL